MMLASLPPINLNPQIVQTDRIRGIAEYLTTPPDPMQWVWLGVILISFTLLVLLLRWLNRLQKKKARERREARRKAAGEPRVKTHPSNRRIRLPGRPIHPPSRKR